MYEKESFSLDLRGLKCPLNFVRTKLFLEKMKPGDELHVLLDAGETQESVMQSVEAEGHAILGISSQSEGSCLLSICKV